MSYASGTTHYNLPQTVGSDKRDWTDTNQAFSDIDAAIYGAAQGASAATSAIETINGEIETITGKQAVDEGNISTLSGKVSTLESTIGTQGAAIADVRQDLQDNIESNHEASATSTHLYNIGDTFYYNDVLYKATAQIAIGGTIVPSTNCTAVTVMSEIDQLNSDLSEKTVTIVKGSKTFAEGLNELFPTLATLTDSQLAFAVLEIENKYFRIVRFVDTIGYEFNGTVTGTNGIRGYSAISNSDLSKCHFYNFLGNPTDQTTDPLPTDIVLRYH